ncbi:hypothetical protein JNUCC0626_17505 [Lentzea sp. JNUCC 0626]|uniref:hypothetical protein n=1 Tax=Lentzea sp. JNUCC 0626 TaxID=3367513 RepID=UPI0037479381
MSFSCASIREIAAQLHRALHPDGVLIVVREPTDEELLRLALERYFVALRTELVTSARHANVPGTQVSLLVTAYQTR